MSLRKNCEMYLVVLDSLTILYSFMVINVYKSLSFVDNSLKKKTGSTDDQDAYSPHLLRTCTPVRSKNILETNWYKTKAKKIRLTQFCNQ